MVITIPYLFSLEINFKLHLRIKNSLEKEVYDFLDGDYIYGYQGKNKIGAVKYVRDNSEIDDLKKCKKYVDKIEKKYNL